MIQSGSLRHKVTIHTPTLAQSTVTGGMKTTSESSVVVWASVTPLRGYEKFAASQINAMVDTRISMRYTTAINSLSRIVCNGSTFVVEGIVNVNELNVRLDLMCVKVIG